MDGQINTVYLSLGSNLGNREENISSAIEKLNKIGKVSKVSKLFESEPFGFISDNLFYNICLEFKTELSPLNLLEATQTIESEIGRKKKSVNRVYESRLIDIDILFFNKEIIELELLTIPHPQIQFRKFVLSPLNDIAPSFRHPLIRKDISTLLLELD